MFVLGWQYWIFRHPVQGVVAPQAVVKSHLKNLAVCAESYFADLHRYPENLTSLRSFCKADALQKQLNERSAAPQAHYQIDYKHDANGFTISVVNTDGEVWKIRSSTLQVTYQRKN